MEEEEEEERAIGIGDAERSISRSLLHGICSGAANF